MRMQVNIGEAKDRLSQLVAAAGRGDDVVIALAGIPKVRLMPIEPLAKDAEHEALAARLRAFHGSFRGRLDMSLDWKAPSMTEEEVTAWEVREERRYRAGENDETVA